MRAAFDEEYAAILGAPKEAPAEMFMIRPLLFCFIVLMTDWLQ